MALPRCHRPPSLRRTLEFASMFRANDAWRPCTLMSQTVEPSSGPLASGTRRGLPLLRPVVSRTTHQGAHPASARAIGLNRRQNNIAIRRFARCPRVMPAYMMDRNGKSPRLAGSFEAARRQHSPVEVERTPLPHDPRRHRARRRAMSKVLYEKRDRIAYETINRPEARNAIDPDVHRL